jgi:8-amino-7-oxononanoate synthase
MAVAASTALELMEKSSERVNRLQHNARFFISKLKEHGLCTGRSAGYAVVPVIIGSSHKAVNISNALYEKGIDVLPIIHPAVEEQQARLRFFITSEHTEQDLGRTADLLAEIAEKENIL